MTASVISKNAFFKAYFLRRKKEGLPPKKALLAAAHKFDTTFLTERRNLISSLEKALLVRI
jgi:hypothetical protein